MTPTRRTTELSEMYSAFNALHSEAVQQPAQARPTSRYLEVLDQMESISEHARRSYRGAPQPERRKA